MCPCVKKSMNLQKSWTVRKQKWGNSGLSPLGTIKNTRNQLAAKLNVLTFRKNQRR